MVQEDGSPVKLENTSGSLKTITVPGDLTLVGNTHDHNGGDGGQINHVNLASIGTNTHAQIDTFIASKASPSGLASLDAGTKVPTAQLGGAGADATKFLRGDQSWQVVATSVPTGTGFRHVTAGSEDAAAKLVANDDVDAAAAIAATKIATNVSGYFRQFWQKQGTVVQGTWAWYTDAFQTDYATVTGEAAGYYLNSSAGNLDEYKWANIFLAPGTYKLTIAHNKGANAGIIEILFGTTSLGTIDTYGSPPTYNLIDTITFTITSPTTADLRYRVNGKNASSAGYYIEFARLQLEKTG